MSAVWWSSRLAPRGLNAQFVDAFKETFHREPEWYGALAYESARALFAAIERSGSVDRELVRANLAALQMDSIVPGGRLAFGGDQQGALSVPHPAEHAGREVAHRLPERSGGRDGRRSQPDVQLARRRPTRPGPATDPDGGRTPQSQTVNKAWLG